MTVVPVDCVLVEIADEAAPWRIDEVTRTDFVRFAGASGDFNPIHHDDEFARSKGYPSVFGHGMLVAGFLSKYLTDWAGIHTTRWLGFRFHTQVWPGDSLTLSGRVVRRFEEGGEHRAECELSAVNQNGEVLGSAKAVVAVLPGGGSTG